MLRAVLTNLLPCFLALWGASRTENDTAKCLIIFWCLFAFIAAGFEHSVANMTVFSVALMSEHPETVSFIGAARNLLWVTLGNTFAGTVMMGFGYWMAAGRPRAQSAETGANNPALARLGESQNDAPANEQWRENT